MAPQTASMLARAASSAWAHACRASRAAALASARAARSAAAARRAAAAVSRAARSSTDATAATTTAADLALGTSTREARSFASTNARLPLALDTVGDSVRSDRCLSPDDKPQIPEAQFVADEKDLESDEALWALYERWCKHFNEERDRDEMARRFPEFKKVVLLIHQENNSDRPYKLAINQFTDGKLSEVCLRGNGFLEEKHAAKLPKTGSWFIWMNGKYYMELPEEFQPE